MSTSVRAQDSECCFSLVLQGFDHNYATFVNHHQSQFGRYLGGAYTTDAYDMTAPHPKANTGLRTLGCSWSLFLCHGVRTLVFGSRNHEI